MRLGHNAFSSGQLDNTAQTSAIAGLLNFKNSMKRLNVTNYKAVATSAVRESANGKSFVNRVKRETGIDIEIITGSEEVRLVYLAVKQKIPLGTRKWLIVNLGGGSVEVCLADNSGIIWNQTHTIGTVRLYEELTDNGKEPLEFKKLISEYISTIQLPKIKKMENIGFIATGGNIEELAKIAKTPTNKSGISILHKGALHSIGLSLSKLTYEERIKKLNLRKDRADVILPAALVYEKFANLAEASKIIVPYTGTREGILFDIVNNITSPQEHLLEKEKQISSIALEIGRHYQFDEPHGMHVAKLGLSIFDQIKNIIEHHPNDRNILLAASMLHDIGTFISYKGHHKHSLYLISQSEIPGLNGHEIILAANIARYHRKIGPSIKHESFARLTLPEQKQVTRLSAILRIADALDREHIQNVKEIFVSVEKPNLLLTLKANSGTYTEEWAVKKKGELFEKNMGLKIIIKKILSMKGADAKS
ncbi:exopolyphosphatase [Candidatus Omnitrophus magneticus]|uniref:Exopolyphosphatase n=1 Tax=Candidatus Omnitrophus magneticus TaxID=1609969 RepID=A0A0F0CU91_9BACT|nr:exopolyphosphatase [Candidatus Omnitrophus magneticus]